VKRILVVLAVALVTLSLAVGPVAAGRNSGPEQLAKGRGAMLTTSAPVTTTVLSTFCFVNTSTCGAPVEVATATATTEVRQTFDFDAKLGPHTDSLDTTDGPSGRIKLTYEATTITVVTLSGFGPMFCDDPAYTITPACPEPGSSTTTESATATAEVTCLLTVQNRATIGGHVTRFQGTFTPTRGILLNVTDNTIARQQVGADRFLGAFVADVPNTCPAPTADHPITTGDIYVDQS
jgi:hypothetical protein